VLEHFSQERQVLETGEFYREGLGRTQPSVPRHEMRQVVAS
jgi:hypothetical protein